MTSRYYEFYCPVKILAGLKALEHLPAELAERGCKAPMVLTEPRSSDELGEAFAVRGVRLDSGDLARLAADADVIAAGKRCFGQETDMTETKIGTITHYYTHLHVAGVLVTDGELRTGDILVKCSAGGGKHVPELAGLNAADSEEVLNRLKSIMAIYAAREN